MKYKTYSLRRIRNVIGLLHLWQKFLYERLYSSISLLTDVRLIYGCKKEFMFTCLSEIKRKTSFLLNY